MSIIVTLYQLRASPIKYILAVFSFYLIYDKGKFVFMVGKVALFCVFLLSTVCYLSSKCISEGECVSLVYYLPFQWYDYVLLFLLGLTFGGLSVILTKKQQSKKYKIIEAAIYAVIVVIICCFANDILESVEYNWPHRYSPSQYIGNSL